MKKDKKILIVAPYGFNDRMTSFIEFTVGRVLACHKWSVVAIVKSDSNISSFDTVCGVTVYRYTSLGQGFLMAIKIFLFFRPGIVHIHNLRNNRVGIIISMLTKIVRTPLLFTEYGLLHDHYLTDDRDNPLYQAIHTENVISKLSILFRRIFHERQKWQYFFSSYLFHWPLTHADSIVFVSKHNIPITKSLGLENYLYLPQIMDNRRWLYKGVDLDNSLLSHHGEVLKRLTQIRLDTNVLFIGQLKLRKGWDILLRSIPFIPVSAVKNFIIVSATSDEESPEFEALVDTLGIRDRIVFLGRVFNGDIMQKVYEASTVVVVPSRYEGFGLVPIEAFEMKKPVVATNVEALNEFLIDGYNALLTPHEDYEGLAKAIVTVVGGENIRDRLVRGGEETLAKMKSEKEHEKWVAYYNQFLT